MFVSIDMFDFELSTLLIFVIGFCYFGLSLWGAHSIHPFNNFQPFALHHNSHDDYDDDGEGGYFLKIESKALSWILERKNDWVWWVTMFDWDNWLSPFWFIAELVCGLSMQTAWFFNCLLQVLFRVFYCMMIDLLISIDNNLRDEDSLLSRAVVVLIFLRTVAKAVSPPLFYAAKGMHGTGVHIAQRIVLQPISRIRGILLDAVCRTQSPVAYIRSMICTSTVQISGFCGMVFQLLRCAVSVASSALWIAAELLLLIAEFFGRASWRAGALFFMIGMAIFRPSSFDHQWSARCEKTEFDYVDDDHNGYGCSHNNRYNDHCRYEHTTPQRTTYAATATPLQYQRPSVNDWNYSGIDRNVNYSHRPTAPYMYYTYQQPSRYNSYY